VLDESWLNVVKARSCDGGKGKRDEGKRECQWLWWREDVRYGEIILEILKGKQMGLVWENFGEG